MSGIRIRVGASLEASALKVFEPLEARAARAGKNIQKALNAGLDGKSVAKAAKHTADALDNELERMANKMLADEERAQKGRTRIVSEQGRERVKLETKAANDVAKAIEDAGRRSGRGGAIGIGKRAAISVSRGAAISYGLSRSAISGGIDLAASLAEGMGVDLSLASHMANANALQQKAVQIANSGYVPGAAGAQGILQNSGDIKQDIYAAGDATGTSHEDIAAGLQKFVGLTGDLETGRKTLLETAKLARATGTDFDKMAEASAEVSNHLGNIPNKAEAVSGVMRVIAGEGKMGALEIRDFARQMAKIAANAPMFEGDIGKTIGDLGLIAQESKLGGGSASASQAATSVAAFARDFSKKTTFKHWNAAGLNPFTDSSHTKLRSPEELILEAIKYSKGDQLKLAQLFPSSMAMRAVKPFSSIYSSASGGELEKLKAVTEEFDRMRNAQMDAREVQRAFGAAMDSSQTKVQLANNRLDELASSLTTALLPAVAGLTPAIESMTPVIVDLINKFANLLGINPNEDADARAERERQDRIKGARAELDAAVNTPETLTKGPNGAVLSKGKFDKTHEAAIQKDADKANAELAEAIARHQQHVESEKKHMTGLHPGTPELSDKDWADGTYGTTGVKGFGVVDVVKAKDRVDNYEPKHIDELRLTANRTNEILEDIHRAIQNGNAQYANQPTPASRDGTSSSNSDGPNSSHE